jgi:hypothetical protein
VNPIESFFCTKTKIKRDKSRSIYRPHGGPAVASMCDVCVDFGYTQIESHPPIQPSSSTGIEKCGGTFSVVILHVFLKMITSFTPVAGLYRIDLHSLLLLYIIIFRPTSIPNSVLFFPQFGRLSFLKMSTKSRPAYSAASLSTDILYQSHTKGEGGICTHTEPTAE